MMCFQIRCAGVTKELARLCLVLGLTSHVLQDTPLQREGILIAGLVPTGRDGGEGRMSVSQTSERQCLQVDQSLRSLCGCRRLGDVQHAQQLAPGESVDGSRCDPLIVHARDP